MAQIEAFLQVVVQEAGGAVQVIASGLDLFFVNIDAEVDLCVAQGGRRVDLGDRDQRSRQRRILHLSREKLGDFLAEQVVNAFDTPTGHAELTYTRSLENISIVS